MKEKKLHGSIKEFGDEPGTATVVFATFEKIDHDGDWLEKGSVGEASVMVVGSHDWEMAPIGTAKLSESGNEAIAKISFNLKMSSASEWYESIKFSHANGGNQQYSFGFRITDSEQAMRAGKSVRVIKGLEIFEVSPVLLAAGINTRTLAIKNRDASPEAKAYVQLAGSWEETQAALQAVLQYELLGDLDGWVCLEGTYPGYVIASRCIWNADEPTTYWRFDWSAEGGSITVSNRQAVTLAATIAEKSAQRFIDHPGRVLSAMLDLEGRTKALVTLRAKAGRTLSQATRDALGRATEGIRNSASTIDTLLAESDKPADAEKSVKTISEADQIAAQLQAQEFEGFFGAKRLGS